MTLIIFTILALYILLIGSYIYGFDKVPEFHVSDILPQTKFTIIIAFRNEAKNLPTLIKSLKTLNYSKSHYEIIFVNDNSEDNSVEIVKEEMVKAELKIQLINREVLTNSPKKDAIVSAINQANNDWIITTDADCSVPEFWLDSFDSFIQNSTCQLIAGPVSYDYKNNFLHQFQALDFMSLMGSTIGSFGLKSPYMANGANLAYKISFFKELNGFSGNSHIASGDDVFLLQKAIKANKGVVRFLKTKKALVTTKPLDSLNQLISQRIRWASKATGYSSVFGKLTGLIVLLMNILVIAAIVLAILHNMSWNSCFYLWIIKLSIDLILIFKTIRFLNYDTLIKSYLWSSIVYPFFISYIAFVSLFKGYSWKGRHFKK